MGPSTDFSSFEQENQQAKVDARLGQFRELDASLAGALDSNTCLRPEIALMLELYEASRVGRAMTVSVLGLLDGIAPTTTLRYMGDIWSCFRKKASCAASRTKPTTE